MIKFKVLILCEDYGFVIEDNRQLNLYCNSRGRGIKILYHNQIRNVEFLNDFTVMNNVVGIVYFNIIEDTCKYIICAIYRPPFSSAVVFYQF